MQNLVTKLRTRSTPSTPSLSNGAQENDTQSKAQLFQHDEHHDLRRYPHRSDQQLRPLKVANVIELGNVRSSTTSVKRDLGFCGRLGNYEFLSFGDTLFGLGEQFKGMTCNSLGIATTSPTEVMDPVLDENGYPRFFLRPNEEVGERIDHYSLGITSIIETRPGSGTSQF